MHKSEDHEIGFMRLPEILKMIPVGKSTWWAGVKSGRYPEPIKLSPRVTSWRRKDIMRLLETLSKSNAQPL